MRVFVTGGLGYIGSHTVVALLAAGHEVIIFDNLSNATEKVLDRIEKISGVRPDFFLGDIRDTELLRNIFSTKKIDGVIHFAALKAVAESFEKRDEYFDVNVGGTKNICAVMEEFGVHCLVYSSSATVYAPATEPIPETAPLAPSNPYGETKLACEQFLQGLTTRGNWSVVLLRYFNPVGAHASGLIGEAPKSPANIAPVIMEVLRGIREYVQVNGTDYETSDGTCSRDYIHVVDLAQAHVSALAYTTTHGGVHIYNVGTGRGYSVKEIIAAFAAAAGQEIPIHVGPRRIGDLACVIADPTKIQNELGWHAEHSLAEMASSAVNWITKNPHGFED